MMEDGKCIGCGGDCLDIIECSCGRREVYACQDCLESGMTLVCGGCRDRAARVVPVGALSCRDFKEDEAGGDRGLQGRLPVAAPVGAWAPPYRAA